MTAPEPFWLLDDVMTMAAEANGYLPLPLCDWTDEELARIAAFDAAPAAPESYVQQHRMEPDCFCGPRQVGTLDIWDHNMGTDQ